MGFGGFVCQFEIANAPRRRMPPLSRLMPPFDPLEENPRRIDTVEAHLRSSSAMGPSQSASKVCEGPIAVIARAIDPE